MSATHAHPGDLVEYADIANPARAWEVLTTPADIVLDGTLWQDMSEFELVDPDTFERCTSDLRQHGWRIVRRADSAPASVTGYLCKKCGTPSPVGVGYRAGPCEDPQSLTRCACGWSRSA